MSHSARHLADCDSIVLSPGDFVLLRPRSPLTPEGASDLIERIPDALRGRVLVVDPAAFDVLTFHPVGTP